MKIFSAVSLDRVVTARAERMTPQQSTDCKSASAQSSVFADSFGGVHRTCGREPASGWKKGWNG